MKKQIQFLINLLFLLLVPVFAGFAAPQSFFISPGQTIKDMEIKRMYCLEYSKNELNADNIAELTRIIGNVRVIYANGRVQTVSLDQLIKSGRVELVPFDSFQFLQFYFWDEDIAEIQIGNEGIGLYRDGMTANEETLSQTNIARIIEMEAMGKTHMEIQETIWRTRTGEWTVSQGAHQIFDFMTTITEGEKVGSRFYNTATVSYEVDGKMFLRLDGLLRNNANVNDQIIELITHYHNDHITRAVVEQAISEGSFDRLIAPYPSIKEARNSLFNSIAEQTGVRDYNFRQENHFLELTYENVPLSRTLSTTVGDFNYSSFWINKDMKVEMYKYKNPRNGEVNDDGLIYMFTHKNVSYLLFGDFDYANGIENLLDASSANEAHYYKNMEEISNLELQSLNIRDELMGLLSYKNYLEYLLQIAEDDPDLLEYQQQILKAIEDRDAQIEERENLIAGLYEKIETLDSELTNLPFIKADVIKWPHHAHVFDNYEKTNNIIRKLIEVVDPQFIIWQTNPAQRDNNFRDYIIRSGFGDKFLCSDNIDFEFISLLDLLNAWSTS